MKKIVLTFLAVFVLFSSYAQEVKNVIKVNPLGFLLGSASLSYERVLGTKTALQFDVNYGDLTIMDTEIKSFGAGVDYRLYFSRDKFAPRGFYFSPGLAYSNATISDVNVSAFSLSGVGGYQWVWNSGFELDLFIGPQYSFGGDISSGSTSYTGYSGLGAKIGVCLGFGF